MKKKIFVTVGTTEFDALLEAVTSPTAIEKFIQRGFTKLTLQKGRGKFSVPKQTQKDLVIECFDYKSSLTDDMNEASLVISHAGAGSILGALALRKPLIVVVNEQLMNNHQYELAMKMSEGEHLYYCTCGQFLDTFTNKDLTKLKQRDEADPRIFGEFLDGFMGIVK